ncbi:hypothetical protein Zmor_016295 [Zophobas morio]|uniref:ABC transporter domain-containing protein n=1 Tax=Zophobas morio TaxID=2755281 RepID=A0AA38HGH9_9CUCU|nr:hypothetical protein Zmor_016295 [Zophobas morio]
MLIGELLPTAGSITINGFDIAKNYGSLGRLKIGYCPQDDPLPDNMTGYQALYIYAILHDIPRSYIKKYISEFLELLDLKKLAHKKCGTYSRGTRRRLSVALSLVVNYYVINRVLFDFSNSWALPGWCSLMNRRQELILQLGENFGICLKDTWALETP